MRPEDDFEDTTLLHQYRDIYPGFDPGARLRRRARLAAEAVQAQGVGGSRPVAEAKHHRMHAAMHSPLGTGVLAALLAITGMSGGLATSSLSTFFASGNAIRAVPAGQVATTATGGPAATAATHPGRPAPVAYPRVAFSRLRSPGSSHFLPDLWREMTVVHPSTRSRPHPATDVPAVLDGGVTRPTLAE